MTPRRRALVLYGYSAICFALEAALACEKRSPEPAADTTTVVDTPVVAPSAAVARSLVLRSDTVRLLDSVKVGDTVSFKRWYYVIRRDSTWVRRPPVLLGIPWGTSSFPLDSLNRPTFGYTGAAFTVNPSSLAADLDKVRARKGRVWLVVSRSATKDANGLSVDATRKELLRYDRAAVAKALKDGTAIGGYLGDDITSKEWGPSPPYLARYDSLARLWDSLWPGSATVVRAKPGELAYNWRWLTTAWAQWNGPYRSGDPRKFRDDNVRLAKERKLGLVLALNFLDGGCGSPTSACLKDSTGAPVPGTDILGTFANAAAIRRYQMSANEVRYYGTIFARELYSCSEIGWRWSPNYASAKPTPAQLAGIRQFHLRPDVRAAMLVVAAAAGTRPTTSCIQR